MCPFIFTTTPLPSLKSGSLGLLCENEKQYSVIYDKKMKEYRKKPFKFENGKIIQSLNPDKVHGHDNASIRMLKICSSAISRSLEIIFKDSMGTGMFPSEWKKVNIISICKKVRSKC